MNEITEVDVRNYSDDAREASWQFFWSWALADLDTKIEPKDIDPYEDDARNTPVRYNDISH